MNLWIMFHSKEYLKSHQIIFCFKYFKDLFSQKEKKNLNHGTRKYGRTRNKSSLVKQIIFKLMNIFFQFRNININ